MRCFALNEMQRRSIRLQPAFEAMGEAMEASNPGRFKEKEALAGTPWAPLSQTNVEREGHDRIIERETHQIARQINYSTTDDALEWGSPTIYALMQHYGGEQSDFPHRWKHIPHGHSWACRATTATKCWHPLALPERRIVTARL
ncbi:phage virion morphogenesis protein [Salinicola halophyticus]|uniref:phage virion morphogenesis protein n=1 Tax=Salinicola halophyticus TaxID=1808881 RepID=UPI003F488B8C